MPGRLPQFDKECFFITPIGEDGSETRRRADGVLDAIVSPAAEAAGLTAIRADRIGEGGQVNLQVIEHVCRAATAIADLTGANLNVYYEVGMRHATRLPLVLIADDCERDKLPFDILVQRTIFFSNDMNGVAACKTQVTEQLKAALTGVVDSPIDAAINIRQFQQGDAVERTLAELVTSVDSLSREVSRGPRSIHPEAIKDLIDSLTELQRIADDRDDQLLADICTRFRMPVQHIVRRSRVDGSEDLVDRIRRSQFGRTRTRDEDDPQRTIELPISKRSTVPAKRGATASKSQKSSKRSTSKQ